MKMFIRLLSIFLLVAIGSCKKNDENTDENYYTITGTVIDQVAKKPLAGASVLLAWAPYCENINSNLLNIEIKEPVLTGDNGNFKIFVLKTKYDSPFPGCKVVYALKSGFSSSSKIQPPMGGGDINQKLELYHFAQVKLHVQNDTIINNIDDAEIWLDWINVPYSYPHYRYSCSGKNFSTTFTLSDLIGNKQYYIWVVKVGEPPPPMTKTI
jgi:hypothetical protein